MQTVTTIGLDIAKSVFQVHGVDAAGQVVVRRQLKRRYVLAFFEKLPPCLIGIEACASSHHWSRELRALGHKVRLMPPAYVRPYVKRQKRIRFGSAPLLQNAASANKAMARPRTTRPNREAQVERMPKCWPKSAPGARQYWRRQPRQTVPSFGHDSLNSGHRLHR